MPPPHTFGSKGKNMNWLKKLFGKSVVSKSPCPTAQTAAGKKPAAAPTVKVPCTDIPKVSADSAPRASSPPSVTTSPADKWREKLHPAAGAGDIATVKQALDDGMDVEATRAGSTPMMVAAYNNRSAVIQLLIDRGADVNAKNGLDCSSLRFAAENGSIDAVKLLIANGADLNSRDNHGETPLMWAARMGQSENTKYLIESGADVNAKDDDYGWTALITVARFGSGQAAKLLIDGGADLNSQGNSGSTALMIACEQRRIDVVKCLLEAGADVGKVNKEGATAAHYAARGRTDLMELLIKHGPDINVQDRNGRTPVTIAENNNDAAMLALLKPNLLPPASVASS